MPTKVYNKLVRDKIPDIIAQSGKRAEISTLNDIDYKNALKSKLLEEVQEFIESEEKEEMADILEVLYALMEVKDTSMEQVQALLLHKRAERGAFKDKIFLKEVQSK